MVPRIYVPGSTLACGWTFSSTGVGIGWLPSTLVEVAAASAWRRLTVCSLRFWLDVEGCGEAVAIFSLSAIF